jgi:hypothetical protein
MPPILDVTFLHNGLEYRVVVSCPFPSYSGFYIYVNDYFVGQIVTYARWGWSLGIHTVIDYLRFPITSDDIGAIIDVIQGLEPYADTYK